MHSKLERRYERANTIGIIKLMYSEYGATRMKKKRRKITENNVKQKGKNYMFATYYNLQLTKTWLKSVYNLLTAFCLEKGLSYPLLSGRLYFVFYKNRLFFYLLRSWGQTDMNPISNFRMNWKKNEVAEGQEE